jgi:hypothetical protein
MSIAEGEGMSNGRSRWHPQKSVAKAETPTRADEQEYPEPERLTTPDEEAGQDIAELAEPPQAEGRREDVE